MAKKSGMSLMDVPLVKRINTASEVMGLKRQTLQLISKANCQAVNSSKKRTNEFVFTNMRRVFVPLVYQIVGLRLYANSVK